MKKAKGIGAANKRRRLQESETFKDPILKTGLTEEAIADAKKQLETAEPFPHVEIRPFCEEPRLHEAFDQSLKHLSADLRESDSFKVYETQGLQHIDPDEKGLGAVKSLRDSLYGEDFRSFVSKVFDCGTLSPTVDCVNYILNEGCHMLCGHQTPDPSRKIGFLLFLTPADDGWEPADGGMLELYEEGENASLTPKKQILPLWNSMVLFDARGKGSAQFGIGEVFAAEKTQLCVMGWFHAAEATDNGEPGGGSPARNRAFSGTGRVGRMQPDGAPGMMAEAEGGGDDWGEFKEIQGNTAGAPSGELSEEDRAVLGRFVSATYLEPSTLHAICAQFEHDSSAILHDFLLPEVAAAIASATARDDRQAALGRSRRPEFDAGVGGGWKEAGPPTKRRCLVYGGGSGGEGAGAQLGRVREELFGSGAFHRLLAAVSGLQPLSSRSVCRRFRPGLDYSKATAPNTGPPSTLDATLCFVDEEEDGEGGAAGAGGTKMSAAEKRDMWQSSLIGGYECYAESEGQRPYVLYDGARKRGAPEGAEGGSAGGAEGAKGGDAGDDGDDGENEPLAQGVAKCNTLFVAYRDEGVASFVKYVGGVAPGSRWDVAMQAVVEAGEDEGEEEGA